MLNDKLINEARTCLKVLTDPSAPDRERSRWTAWLTAEPENREAYLAVGGNQAEAGDATQPIWSLAVYIGLIVLIIVLVSWILMVVL
jgi:ferric-dicitrate binding protein FerR (iron transport regulator)